jgi:hypothetical protein
LQFTDKVADVLGAVKDIIGAEDFFLFELQRQRNGVCQVVNFLN